MRHPTKELPARIAVGVAVTILIIVCIAAVTIVLMTRALDRQAREQSELQVEIVRDNLLGRIKLITLDYTKWDAAYQAARDGSDPAWLLDNVGSAAIIGEAVQLAVIWGRGFPSDLGWSDDGTVEPRAGLLPTATLAAAERNLATAEPGEFDSTEFFEWREDELFVLGAAHFEPVEHADQTPQDQRFGGLLFMGMRIDSDVVADIGHSLSLTGTNILRSAPADQLSLGLPGADGSPVAYFAWDRPHPGTQMLRRMAPFLVLITGVAAALAALNMQFAKRGAEDLVVAEARASRAARTDTLTGLPNRLAFKDVLAAPARAGERAILFLDINDFKRINDSIGHAAGDAVIVSVARRLAAFVDPACLLARVGGDELVFVLSGAGAEARTLRLAARAQEVLEQPFSVLGHHIELRVAMGSAIQLDDDITGDELVRQADLAMYEAKRQRERQPVAFSRLLEAAARDAADIEHGLRKALERPDELSIVYQPIIDMKGRMVRAEALARWTSPELGVVPPDRFIVVAERAGLIVELGHKLIELICRDLVSHPSLAISLNISPLQLMAPNFISMLVHELRRRTIHQSRVEIELTESVIVDDTRLASERLEALQAAGFSIALDDFGTGYSSIGYLARLRFNTLKIDRSFVPRVRGTTQEMSVIDGMIRIAHGLGLRIVCEGVETAEEFNRLKELGCDLVQGYYLDPPLPIAKLAERWLTLSLPAGDAPGSEIVPLRSGIA